MNDHDLGCIFICIILLWSLYLKGYLFIFIFLTFDDCYITMNVLSLGAILLFSSIWISMLIYHVWAIWQLLIGVHSVNVVFLLGDTALNCLVSCIFVSNILLITDSNCNFNPVFQIPCLSGFHGSKFPTLSSELLCLPSSNGSSMPAFHFGKLFLSYSFRLHLLIWGRSCLLWLRC